MIEAVGFRVFSRTHTWRCRMKTIQILVLIIIAGLILLIRECGSIPSKEEVPVEFQEYVEKDGNEVNVRYSVPREAWPVFEKVSVKDVRATPNTGFTDAHVKTFRDSMAKGFAQKGPFNVERGSKSGQKPSVLLLTFTLFYYKEGATVAGFNIISQLRVEIIGELPDGTRLFRTPYKLVAVGNRGLTYILKMPGEEFHSSLPLYLGIL